MPSKRLFESMADYYQTLFHELIHATEKSTRVGQREGHDYCFGELVAEMGACFLLTELGVPLSEQMIPKSQSYLQNWLSKMGGDPKYVFAAASQASKATDYLLGFVGKQNPDYESPDDSEEEVSPERNAA
jgi:antirestriction protein ArdC